MSKVRVICPKHGIIKEIEMACMWLGRPPFPEVDNAYCPYCGAKTVVERDNEPMVKTWTYQSDDRDCRKRMIDAHRKRYKSLLTNFNKL